MKKRILNFSIPTNNSNLKNGDGIVFLNGNAKPGLNRPGTNNSNEYPNSNDDFNLDRYKQVREATIANVRSRHVSVPPPVQVNRLSEFKQNYGLRDGERIGDLVVNTPGEYHTIFYIMNGDRRVGIRKIAALAEKPRFKSIDSKQFLEDTMKEIQMYTILRTKPEHDRYLLPVRETSAPVIQDRTAVAAILDFDYVDGYSFRDFIRKHLSYSFKQFIPLLLEIIRSIQWLLRCGYIHTDINSKNFWIVNGTRPDGSADVRILDLADIIDLESTKDKELKQAYEWSVNKRRFSNFGRNETGFIGLVEACKPSPDIIVYLEGLFESHKPHDITGFYEEAYDYLRPMMAGGRRKQTRKRRHTKRRRNRSRKHR